MLNPLGRQQRAEVVLSGHGWHALEHVGEVGLRVDRGGGRIEACDGYPKRWFTPLFVV